MWLIAIKTELDRTHVFNVFTQHAGLFYLSQLLFKNYYIAALKLARN